VPIEAHVTAEREWSKEIRAEWWFLIHMQSPLHHEISGGPGALRRRALAFGYGGGPAWLAWPRRDRPSRPATGEREAEPKTT
jgi:hypothetical protein